MNDTEKKQGVAVRRQGKTRGAFGFALNFWPPFVSRQKVENKPSERMQYQYGLLKKFKHLSFWDASCVSMTKARE